MMCLCLGIKEFQIILGLLLLKVNGMQSLEKLKRIGILLRNEITRMITDYMISSMNAGLHDFKYDYMIDECRITGLIK
jgi:hypothetical protein